eukprot:gene6066-6304_t
MVDYTAEPDTATVWGPLVSVIVIVLSNVVTYAANENSWVFKHLLRPLGMPPILFISNRQYFMALEATSWPFTGACRADDLDKHTRPLSYWAFDLLDSEHLVHSNCLSTPLLLVLHACTFLYFAATVVVDVVIGGGPADTVVVVEGPPGDSAATDSRILQRRLRQQWDWLSCVHCILMEVATTAAFFVAFWYWVGVVAIAGRGFSPTGGTLMAHAGNAFIALLEVVLTRLPMVSYHFQVLLWYATLYLIFLWAFGGATEIWRYGLDWQQSKPAGAFCIIPVITFIMFALWWVLQD